VVFARSIGPIRPIGPIGQIASMVASAAFRLIYLVFTSSNRLGPTPQTGHFSGGAVPIWMNPHTTHFHFFTDATSEKYTAKIHPQIARIGQRGCRLPQRLPPRLQERLKSLLHLCEIRAICGWSRSYFTPLNVRIGFCGTYCAIRASIISLSRPLVMACPDFRSNSSSFR